MSLEAWGDSGMDDDGETLAERATDAGYLDPESVEMLKELLQHVDIPTEHSKGMAAFILIEGILNPRIMEEGSDDAVRVAWARTKLGRT